LSPAQLSKKAANYVPTLSEDGELDRCILHMMDGSKSLGEIADALTQNFPDRFANWNDALARGANSPSDTVVRLGSLAFHCSQGPINLC
jgi:hypothetical protein